MGIIIKSITKKKYKTTRFIGMGGQGEAKECVRLDTQEPYVVKTYHDQFVNQATSIRIRWLAQQKLGLLCPVLKSPDDVFENINARQLGHFTPFVKGESLEEFLQKPAHPLIDNLTIAVGFVHAIAVLHSRAIAHGDLQSNNIIINIINKNNKLVFEVYIIDFDNFSAPGLPQPPCSGHELYMSPGSRNGGVPSIQSDLFCLTIIVHELILLKHPVAGFDSEQKQFEDVMTGGIWQQDPALIRAQQKTAGGYPVEILNADIMRLFRHGLSRDRAERPSARQWEQTLTQILNEVFICPNCNGPTLIDASKTICPFCHNPYPYLTLNIQGKLTPLTNGATKLGRNEMSGSSRISLIHAIVRRIGPEYWIEDVSLNGTYRWNGTGWLRLPKNKPVLLQKGNRLLFADVEGVVN
jgi:serine/threonine protein kinase